MAKRFQSKPLKTQEDFSLKQTYPNINGKKSYDLVEKMQFLYVKVLKAVNFSEIFDSYVEVKLGNCKGTTKTSVKTMNPEWRQVFAFPSEKIQASSVEIFVMNKVAGPNDGILGRVILNTSDIPKRISPDSQLAPQWYKLEDKNGVKLRAELMLAVWMGTQADEDYSNAWHTDVSSGDWIANTQSKIYHSPMLWYLRVNIIEAQDLVISDKVRRPEIIVEAKLGQRVKMATKISESKNLNPVWNEDLIFVAAEPFDNLVIEVIDLISQNKIEVLGKCVVFLNNVEKRIDSSPAANKWYNLMRPEGEGGKKEVRFASRLHMRISLDGGYHVFDEPTHYTSDLRPSSKALWPPSIGVLEVGILSAGGLLPMKPRENRTDAYCVAKYGPKWARTRTATDSFCPKWNEQYVWEVYDPCTVLTIGVFDNCNLQGGNHGFDTRIGKVRIRLSTLETERVYTHSYPLVALHPSGLKKMGEIQLVVRFSCVSFSNVLNTYTQSLLPEMHYTLPLSVHQLHHLRHQCTAILSERLELAEPKLRREVVHYILDADSHVWSLRKAKANLNRLKSLLEGFLPLFRWFEQIQSWKNPTITSSVHVLFVLIIFFPKMIILLLLFYYFVVGIWRYRTRPRHPPHMDPRLSHAHFTTSDELEEEFDSFPSNAPVEVLRMRYDRMRHIAGKMQVVIGDMATQGERIESLLSWRDPRATAIFVIFCLVTGIVIYIVPFRILLVCVVVYGFRHPRFRLTLPSLPQNFLRRLPARTDSML